MVAGTLGKMPPRFLASKERDNKFMKLATILVGNVKPVATDSRH
ncbi:hypothetical protein GAMM_70001 [Gammaproteobacteria bacterium]